MNQDTINIQRLHNFYNPDYTLSIDGQLGPKTKQALHNWVARVMPQAIPSTPAPFEPAAIQAIIEVESPKGAFLSPNQPPILFEAHHFSRLTNRQYDNQYPDISSPHWDRTLYKGGMREYDRLNKASKLNHEAALKSTSWGKFQIMGFNHEAAGYDNVFDFVAAMRRSEEEQDKAFINFIMSNNRLKNALRHKDWETFARIYNGPGYKTNKYDQRIAEAYQRIKAEEATV